jgi:hypothetical protein
MYDKSYLKEQLSKHIAYIVFIKADGTNREMTCTLMPSMLPEVKLVESHVPRKQNDEILAVWDLDNKAWRSFRLDSIIEVHYIKEIDYAASA